MIYLTFGLLALGLLLILVEVFIPSMGILGTLAAGSIVTGGVLAFQHDPNGLFVGYLITSVVLIPLMIFTGLRILPKTPIGKALMISGPSFSSEEAQASEAGLDELVSREGAAVTHLRPAGIAMFDDRRVDVVTQGELVDKGSRVRVIKVEGNRVVVEEIEEESKY